LVIVVVVLGTEIVVSAKVVGVKEGVLEIEVQSILLMYPSFALFWKRRRKRKNEKMDRTSDIRAFAVCVEAAKEGELGSAVVVGRALSLALRLKNKYNGVNQTHIPKKDAISAKL